MYPKDDPVEQERKKLPQGSGDWPGHDFVWDYLQQCAHVLSKNPQTRCGDEHVMLMAIMGCGHEETMKAELHRLYGRNLI